MCSRLRPDLPRTSTWSVDSQYKYAWLFDYKWLKYLPRPVNNIILSITDGFKLILRLLEILLFWTYLYLIVGCWVFEIVSETVGFRTSLIFSWWKRMSLFYPLVRFQYSDALIFIKFTFNIECMIFWIRPNFEAAVDSNSKVEILLAGCCKSMSSINFFLEVECQNKQFKTIPWASYRKVVNFGRQSSFQQRHTWFYLFDFLWGFIFISSCIFDQRWYTVFQLKWISIKILFFLHDKIKRQFYNSSIETILGQFLLDYLIWIIIG